MICAALIVLASVQAADPSAFRSETKTETNTETEIATGLASVSDVKVDAMAAVAPEIYRPLPVYPGKFLVIPSFLFVA